MTMSEAFEKRLNELLDTRQDARHDPQLAQLMARSPECRQLLRAYEAFEQLGEVPLDVAARKEFIQSVVATAHVEWADRRASVRRRRAVGWVSAALTAAVSVAAAVLLFFAVERQGAGPSVAQPSERPDTTTPSVDGAVASQTDAGSRRAAAGEELQSVESAVGELVALATGMSMVGAVRDESGRPALNAEVVGQMTTNVRPVAQSTSDFLDTVLDAFDVENDRRS